MELIRRLATYFSSQDLIHHSGDDEQVEAAQVPGTIWNAVLKADLAAVKTLCATDPSVVEQRGAVGEIPIHMCFLFNSPAHLDIARWFINNYPKTLTAQYEGTEYTGENVLHIAIINQDFDTVKELVSRGNKDIFTAKATGKFFQHGSACYYGEYPLAFAFCTNQPKIAEYLLDNGADIECVDERGNNILHLLVIHNLPKMYELVKKEYKKRIKGEGPVVQASGEEKENGEDAGQASTEASRAAGVKTPQMKNANLVIPEVDLWNRTNGDGLTPFCLSAKINSTDMFDFLLEEQKQTQWTYGPVSCELFPLAQLDLALSRDGEEHSPAALELIMHEGNINLLMHPQIINLVDQKWDKFAERIFKQRFRTMLTYLTLFTLTCIVRQTVGHIDQKEEALLEKGEAASDSSNPHNYIGWAFFIYQYPIILWAMEFAVLFGAWYKGHKEFAEMWRSGVKEYFSSSGSALLENSLSCIFCGCIFVVFLLSLIEHPAQTAVLAVASIAGWSYIFFFLLAFRLTGPMVVMIHQMLTNDVLRFCLIYLVFLMGFAQAFFVLFESVGFNGFIVSIKTCFVAMLGDFELDQFADTPYTAVSVGLLVVYVVTITILLLNLLIAMMGDTYEKINESAEKQWHLERARIIFAIENEMTAQEREDPLNKYWTQVGDERFLQVLQNKPNHFKPEPRIYTKAKEEEEDD